jgi:hypothetical protein
VHVYMADSSDLDIVRLPILIIVYAGIGVKETTKLDEHRIWIEG